MDIKALEDFLNQHTIPKIKKRPKTFLGIAKQPHYENVMSNIYAFYFTVSEVHGMNDLFIASLVELINESKLGEQKKVSGIIDFEVDTEVTTKNNGRIDILLSSPDHAIIIENKIYHTLNNNLVDYWNTTKVTNDLEENKIGILLSLNKQSPTHPHFINITHLEFLKRVIQNLGNYLMEAKDKYVVFLKDFYQNTLNMSKSEMESKDLKFYYNNQVKILEVKNFHFAVREHIINQIEMIPNLIGEIEQFNLLKPKKDIEKRGRELVSPKNKNLIILVLFEDLLTLNKSLKIVVKMLNGLLKNKEWYKAIPFTEEENELISDKFYSDSNTNWCHFASKRYTLTEDNVANLGQFIMEKLEKDGLLSIYRKVNEVV